MIQINFKNYYERYSRYPQSMFSTLSQIGGLLAIFKIGMVLSYFHQKNYEKELLEEFAGSNEGEKPQLRDAKKALSLQNYLKLAIDQRQEIDIQKRLIENLIDEMQLMQKEIDTIKKDS